MKRSFLLGIAGGIFSFLMGILAIFIMAMGQADGVDIDLTINIALAFSAGILGIVGGVVSNKNGGVILIVSAVLALIATSLFGILPFILLLVGGILAFRERVAPEIEPVVKDLLPEKSKREFRGNVRYYFTIIAAIAAIITLALNGMNFYRGLYLQPRARLTVSIGSFEVSGSGTWDSMSVSVTISNYSPRTANILKDWNLTLVFSNSTFQFPNQNCSYGATELDPAQQTEYVFSYDIKNNTAIDVNSLKSLIFTISYIDDQGTQQQQFMFIRPYS